MKHPVNGLEVVTATSKIPHPRSEVQSCLDRFREQSFIQSRNLQISLEGKRANICIMGSFLFDEFCGCLGALYDIKDPINSGFQYFGITILRGAVEDRSILFAHLPEQKGKA